MQAIFETIFDIAYLITVITLGVRMIRAGKNNADWRLFGVMAVVLGGGDAFHLLPRVWALWAGGMEKYTAALGVGKLVTSVTMTVFYLLLYFVWRRRYAVQGKKSLDAVVYVLAAARVLLCLAPQNQWLSAHPPLSWGIARNIPFTLLGILLMVLFYRSSRWHGDRAFWNLWLMLALSFGFYLPVVLFADTVPAVGVLMLPKTCAYVGAVLIGYRDMKNNPPV